MTEKIVKHKVYLECSETTKKVKAAILQKDEKDLQVKTPTGYILNLKKRTRRSQYSIRIGIVEFHSDGKSIS